MRLIAALLGMLLAAVALTGCAAPSTPSARATFAGCAGYPNRGTAQRGWEAAGRPASFDRNHDDRVCESAGVNRHASTAGCRRSRRVVVVRISAKQYSATADHVLDAIAAGHPRILHLDRAGAEPNRARSLAGIPTRRGYDRDEYPPAVSREGGAGADVRYVPSADNRGAGSVLGDRLEGYCDGQRFRLRVTGVSSSGR
jgi:hypothetical protein